MILLQNKSFKRCNVFQQTASSMVCALVSRWTCALETTMPSVLKWSVCARKEPVPSTAHAYQVRNDFAVFVWCGIYTQAYVGESPTNCVDSQWAFKHIIQNASLTELLNPSLRSKMYCLGCQCVYYHFMIEMDVLFDDHLFLNLYLRRWTLGRCLPHWMSSWEERCLQERNLRLRAGIHWTQRPVRQRY